MNKTHPDEVPALTGLRFLAAFSIVIAHGTAVLMHGHERPGSVAYWCTQASDFGMALFFVLSGFVIHYNYASVVTEGRLAGIAAYLWARFARLYPLFLLTLLGYVLVSRKHFEFWSGHPDEFRNVLQALPYFLFSVQSWFYVPIGDTTLIYAIGGSTSLTWSISTEWFFYFLYPLVAWLILRSRAPWLTIVAVLSWCVLWIAISTSLYDRGPAINAWAVERYGPIAEMRQPQDNFRGAGIIRVLAVAFFALSAPGRIHIGQPHRATLRAAADLETGQLGECDRNRVISRRRRQHIRDQLFGIWPGRRHERLPQDVYELRAGALRGALGVRRCPLSQRLFAAAGVPAFSCPGRRQLLDLPRALYRADDRHEIDRAGSA